MSKSIGQILRQAREDRSLTLGQVSRAIHIRVRYLQALEADEYETLPSRVQARGFLRSYASYLGLDTAQLLLTPETSLEAQPPTLEAEQPAPELSEARAEEEDAFAEVGQQLRTQRELLGLSISDVERHTHLRVHYLQALEAGQLDALPSPVQGRGMLKNYAGFLGLDPDPLLLRFADGLQARLAARQAAQPDRPMRKEPKPVRPPSPLRRFFSTEMLIGVSLVLLLAVFMVWGIIRVFDIQSAEGTSPTAPSISEVLLASPSPTFSPTPPSPTATNPAIILETQPPENELVSTPLAAGEGVRVYVTVRQRAWLRVQVDGEIEFEGRVAPGNAYQFAGDESIDILTGNGAAVQLFYNQRDLGPMGLFGQVVHRVFTADGIVTPTPTITLTPTSTPRPTKTPRLSPTP